MVEKNFEHLVKVTTETNFLLASDNDDLLSWINKKIQENSGGEYSGMAVMIMPQLPAQS